MKQATNISFSLEAAGGPFHDPALLVTPINSNEALLLDCGTLHSIRTRSLMRIRWLFLSHLHIDHLIGFDHLLRVRLFSDLPLSVFGPPGTVEVIGHRLQGYSWNLTSGSPFIVHAHDLPPNADSQSRAASFACNDKFVPAPLSEPPANQPLCLSPRIEVQWCPVKHGVACYSYRVTQTFPSQFSPESCSRLGLRPGPWVSQLTDGQPVTQTVDGRQRDAQWLSERLLRVRAPETLGYLTDTLLDAEVQSRLASFFQDVDLLVSEAAYLKSEVQSATQNLHMTTAQIGRLARQCKAKQLLLFHLSRRHIEKGPEQHLAEVRDLFPNTNLLAEFSRCSSETLS